MGFAGCKFCHGRGCIACDGERKKAEQKSLESPFIVDPNNPDDMELLKEAIGREAIEYAIKKYGGGWVQAIEQNIAIARLFQHLRQDEQPKSDD